MYPIRMPKWGLSMQEGTIVHWWKNVGDLLSPGEDLVDIETSKITNVLEAGDAGILSRVIAEVGQSMPVGALLGVITDGMAPDSDIDSFIIDYNSRFEVENVELAEAVASRISYVDTGGGSLRLVEAGLEHGAPVLFIHGFAGDATAWSLNMAPLVSTKRVIAIDLPGHGGSTKDVGDGRISTIAALVASVFRELNLRGVHVIGHSLGAAVAMRLAIDHPDRIASTTAICPALLPGTVTSAEFLKGVVTSRRARDLKPVLEKLFGDPGILSRVLIEDILKQKRVDGAEEAWAKLAECLLDPNEASTLACEIAAAKKVQIIVSSDDPIVGMPDKLLLPESFLIHVLDGKGHMPQVEQSGRVNSLISSWIE